MAVATTTRLDVGLLILRLGTAVIVLFHGIFKVMNSVEWIKGPLGERGLPGFLAYGVYAAEVVAPILLILGMWTRLAGLVIAFDMAMAAFLVLGPQLTQIKEAGGGWGVELEALIFFASLALFFTGGGRLGMAPSGSRWN